jgi:ABC-type nitrate/sulfonate/bicarbonate transport system permease component
MAVRAGDVRFTRFNWRGWLLLLAVLALWQSGVGLSPALRLYFPRPSEIAAACGSLVLSGEFLNHLFATLRRFAQGYVLAGMIAVGLGIILGYFRFAHSLVAVVIEFLRPMPSVAIIPVAVLLLGLGDSMIAAVTVYASVWPILINTIDGVRQIDQTLVHTGRTFGLSSARILWTVILPAAMPHIVTGLRVSLSIALILVTTAEMVAGSQGLGFFILDEERALRTVNMYAGILFVAIVGYGLNASFRAIEKRLMKWRRTERLSEAIS